jgi:beta-glucosidase
MKTGKTSKTIILILLSILILTACGQKINDKDDPASYKYQEYAGMSAEEILSSLTTEQKAMQMVQPACYNTDPKKMKKNCYGSVLSRNFYYDSKQWRAYIGSFQEMAVRSEAGIPFIYGQDDVHGVNYALNTVIFPHNICLARKVRAWRMCFAVNVISKAHCPVRGMIRSLGSKRKQHGWRKAMA